MDYVKAGKYDMRTIRGLIMGPNPVKLAEELLLYTRIPAGAVVMDLGCGRGITSVFLVKEYGFRVFATDLWISPTENKRLFDEMGLTADEAVPIHADANDLPYAEGFFDAVVSIDSYQYFGCDPDYLEKKLLPFVKRGGSICICVPGMKKDCHDDLPPELLVSWTRDDLDTIHDADYWMRTAGKAKGAEVISIHEMESNREVWDDWLDCDNEYARADRRAMEAGGGKYLNFISIILKKE